MYVTTPQSAINQREKDATFIKSLSSFFTPYLDEFILLLWLPATSQTCEVQAYRVLEVFFTEKNFQGLSWLNHVAKHQPASCLYSNIR